MRLAQIKCSCSELVLKSNNHHSSKIRSKVILIKDDAVFAVCKGCNKEMLLPLKIDESVNTEIANPPLFIKNY